MQNSSKAYGVKKNGKFFFPEHELANEKAFEDSLKDGDAVVRETKKYYEPKTHQQCKAIFGLMISSAIEQINEMGLDTSGFLKLLLRDDLPTGVPLTKDILYNLLISLCPVYEDGVKLTLSKMSTKQAAEFFDKSRNLLSSRGIYIDDPNPAYREQRQEHEGGREIEEVK